LCVIQGRAGERRRHTDRKDDNVPARPAPSAPVEASGDDAGELDVASAFPVVGIGASAGGLDALEHFFASVPVDCGMAFVVIRGDPRQRAARGRDARQRASASERKKSSPPRT
jgi:chemotaxis response regulator CheB